MNDKYNPIGFFDSGLGGISVLKESIKLLPNENFIYFGDSINAPYGSKSIEEIRELTNKAIEFLISKNVKAIVIACNTATSASVNELRDKYSKDIPILGIEPALKPASLSNKKGSIVVMATERTLSEKKFFDLMDKVAKQRDVIKLPCPSLVKFVENGSQNSKETVEYIKDRFKNIDINNISAIVLGCTHFPFAKKALIEAVGNIDLYDGAVGISNHLKRTLSSLNLLNDSTKKGTVEFFNSLNTEKIKELQYRLLHE